MGYFFFIIHRNSRGERETDGSGSTPCCMSKDLSLLWLCQTHGFPATNQITRSAGISANASQSRFCYFSIAPLFIPEVRASSPPLCTFSIKGTCTLEAGCVLCCSSEETAKFPPYPVREASPFARFPLAKVFCAVCPAGALFHLVSSWQTAAPETPGESSDLQP